jgi:hypothetical protein
MYQITSEDSYIETALRVSDAIRKYGLLKKGVGLCHGMSGSALALLKLWKTLQHTKRDADEYLEYFLQFIGVIAKAPNSLLSTPDHPFSLFEGMAGGVSVMVMAKKILEWTNQNQDIDWDKLHFPAFDYPF